LRNTDHNFFLRFIIFAVLVFLIGSCQTKSAENQQMNSAANQADSNLDRLRSAIEATKPFFTPLPTPGPNDWLASFHEPGQTFAEYIQSNPTTPTLERKTIYVLPLGNFSPRQNKVIAVASGYLKAFYGLPIKTLGPQAIKRPLQIKNSRTNAISKKEQIRTGYILDEVLRPMLPSDGAALIAFTNEDLYPDNSMNYVFGQASLENRVGVWSLYRLDTKSDIRTFLLRTIKIAAHETGHMFSMHHCTAFNCVMSGSNHLSETDSHPIDACPECMAKVCWFSKVSPAERYKRLAEFCRNNGLDKEADEFDAKLSAVKSLD